MKDALGHGSAAHQFGVQSVGTPPTRVSQRALDAIRQHPEGFSVSPGGNVPAKGYMVSYPGRTQFVDAAALAGPDGIHIINDFARRNADLFSRPDTHIGGWTDKATGKTHLDVSQHQRSRALAENLARVRNQLAIYGVSNKEHWDVNARRFRTRDEIEASPGAEIRTGGKGD